ncbi:MAG: hypothetical protein ACP5RD_02300 [bacterium]|jgi:hypothetical protein
MRYIVNTTNNNKQAIDILLSFLKSNYNLIKVQSINLKDLDIKESLKIIKETLFQKDLFNTQKIFIIYSFSNLIKEGLKDKREKEKFSKQLKLIILNIIENNINVIIDIEDLKLDEIIKLDEEIYKILKDNFKEYVEKKDDKIKLFSKIYPHIPINIIELITKKADIIQAEVILKNLSLVISDLNQEEIIDYINEFELFDPNSINVFIITQDLFDILFKNDYNKYKNLIGLINQIENGYFKELTIEEIWGLIYSQFLFLIKVYNEYTKVGEDINLISSNLKANKYRIIKLMPYIKEINSISKKFPKFFINLINKFFDLEKEIKEGKINYTNAIDNIINSINFRL